MQENVFENVFAKLQPDYVYALICSKNNFLPLGLNQPMN